jgi:hypothetical protein
MPKKLVQWPLFSLQRTGSTLADVAGAAIGSPSEWN